MILDLLANAQLYHGLGPRFARGLEWLRAFDPRSPTGRIVIEGDDLYAMVQAYETKSASEKQFESHRTYADIQFIVSGQEIMAWAPVAELKVVTQPYETKGDCSLYADPKRATDLVLAPNMFAIFWPEDGHKPGCALGTPSKVQKVVLKVRL